jgi:hypothetical protein
LLAFGTGVWKEKQNVKAELNAEKLKDMFAGYISSDGVEVSNQQLDAEYFAQTGAHITDLPGGQINLDRATGTKAAVIGVKDMHAQYADGAFRDTGAQGVQEAWDAQHQTLVDEGRNPGEIDSYYASSVEAVTKLKGLAQKQLTVRQDNEKLGIITTTLTERLETDMDHDETVAAFREYGQSAVENLPNATDEELEQGALDTFKSWATEPHNLDEVSPRAKAILESGAVFTSAGKRTLDAIVDAAEIDQETRAGIPTVEQENEIRALGPRLQKAWLANDQEKIAELANQAMGIHQNFGMSWSNGFIDGLDKNDAFGKQVQRGSSDDELIAQGMAITHYTSNGHTAALQAMNTPLYQIGRGYTEAGKKIQEKLDAAIATLSGLAEVPGRVTRYAKEQVEADPNIGNDLDRPADAVPYNEELVGDLMNYYLLNPRATEVDGRDFVKNHMKDQRTEDTLAVARRKENQGTPATREIATNRVENASKREADTKDALTIAKSDVVSEEGAKTAWVRANVRVGLGGQIPEATPVMPDEELLSPADYPDQQRLDDAKSTEREASRNWHTARRGLSFANEQLTAKDLQLSQDAKRQSPDAQVMDETYNQALPE